MVSWAQCGRELVAKVETQHCGVERDFSRREEACVPRNTGRRGGVGGAAWPQAALGWPACLRPDPAHGPRCPLRSGSCFLTPQGVYLPEAFPAQGCLRSVVTGLRPLARLAAARRPIEGETS